MTVQKPSKVVAQVGIRQVSKVTSAEKGTLVTTCCIISASGNTLPPAMVFPRVHAKPHMIKGAPTGTLCLASKAGWMTSLLFVDVMKHFIHFTNSSVDNPSLIVYDNHESHLSIEVSNLAKSHGVTILTFPPHSTNKLQPLDVGIFKPFTTYYDAAVDSWMMRHPGQTFSIYEVAECVGTAHEKAMSPKNILSAFKATGIFPYDRHVFAESDFMCSYVTDRNMPAAYSNNDQEPLSSGSIMEPSVTPQIFEDSNDLRGAANSTLQSTSTATVLPHIATPEKSIIMTPRLDSNKEAFQVTPVELRGYPKAGERKSKTKQRRTGKSIIATDTPIKNEIEERKKLSNKKSIDKVKKILVDGSDNNKEKISKYRRSSTYSKKTTQRKTLVVAKMKNQ